MTRALDLLDLTATAQRADLLQRRGLAARGSGDSERVEHDWLEAIDLFESLGDAEEVGRTCATLAYSRGWAGRMAEGEALARRGLAVTGTISSATRCLLLSEVGKQIALTNDLKRSDEADVLIQEAQSLLMDIPDSPEALLAAINIATSHSVLGPRPVEQGTAAGRAESIARARNAPWELAEALWNLLWSAHRLGDWARCRRYRAELLPLAERIGNAGAFGLGTNVGGHHDLMQRADFIAHGAAMREIIRREGHGWLTALYTPLATSALWRGALDEAREAAEMAVSSDPGTGLGQSAMIRVLAYARSSDVLDLYHANAHLLPEPGRLPTMGGRHFLDASVEALALTEEVAEVAGLYPLVRDSNFGHLLQGDDLSLSAPIVGIAAGCAGEWDEAVACFERGLQQAIDLPSVLDQPEVRRWYAWMLLRRDAPGDRDRAGELLREAIAQYETLGMPLHLEIATEMLASIGAKPETEAYPDGLTHREMEILLLVARNLRNKDIAESLTISPATVTRHVSNILNKTGLSRRGELVTYAYEHGFLDGLPDST